MTGHEFDNRHGGTPDITIDTVDAANLGLRLAKEERRNAVLQAHRIADVERLHVVVAERDRLELEKHGLIADYRQKMRDVQWQVKAAVGDYERAASKLEKLHQEVLGLRYKGVLDPGRRDARPVLRTILRRHRLLSKARARARARDVAAAAVAYASLLSLDGTKANIWKQFGHVLRSLDEQAALIAYLKALRLDPNNSDTALTIGYFMKDLGRPGEASRIFRGGLARNPDFEPLRVALDEVGGRVEAMEALSQTEIQRRNGSPRPRRLRAARSAAKARKWSKAASIYAELLKDHPGNVALLIQLGHAEKELDRLDVAERCYREAVELEPLNADAHLQLGHLLERKGQEAAGRKAVQIAASLDPSGVFGGWYKVTFGEVSS